MKPNTIYFARGDVLVRNPKVRALLVGHKIFSKTPESRSFLTDALQKVPQKAAVDQTMQKAVRNDLAVTIRRTRSPFPSQFQSGEAELVSLSEKLDRALELAAKLAAKKPSNGKPFGKSVKKGGC